MCQCCPEEGDCTVMENEPALCPSLAALTIAGLLRAGVKSDQCQDFLVVPLANAWSERSTGLRSSLQAGP